jgi:muramoyltetrapeptide carboxypeptidase LdcA involved in peptidoglycan recycling
VKVRPAPHALSDPDWLAANPGARADDLMWAFQDDEISAIVSTIGGDDSIRVLPMLDLGVIRSNPKIVLGFSDTTTIHMACLQAGLTSFYGPSIMAGFAENGGLHRYLVDGVRRVLFEPEDVLQWPENQDGWTVEFLDWRDSANQPRPRRLRPPGGWRWLGGQAAEGPIVAGCVEVLDWLRGTRWWPDLDGAVLAIETSEEQPSSEYLRRFLRSLAATGQLSGLAALLMGRPGGADLAIEEHHAYDDAVLGVVRSEQGHLGMPIVTGMDFGHTDPMWTIPLGVNVRVDPARASVEFLTPAVV